MDSHRGTWGIDPRERERAVMALAARQDGYFSHAQLLKAGLTRGAIEHRIGIGRYVVIHRGVYGAAPLRTDLQGLAWAAVLACGEGALTSHLPAAALWDYVRDPGPMIHVTAPTKRDRPGIITHRATTLAPQDIARQRGVPVTSRARTLLDIAPLLPAKQLRRIVNDHAREGRLRLDAVRDVLQRNPRHPGTKILAPILDDTKHRLTRSRLEDDFLAFLHQHDLPIPRVDTIVNGIEVDAFYPDHNLIIELDTTDYHGDAEQFETDRERDAIHLAHGTPTLRITGERLNHQPAQEARRLRTILDARS